jgi:hypothetical protein
MDPYLEGYLWPDVHTALANKIRQQLTPLLKPRYVARLEISVMQDSPPDSEISLMYPDVEIVLANQQGDPRQQLLGETVAEYQVTLVETPKEGNLDAIIPPAPLIIPLLESIEVRLITVEVRDVAHNELITCIEILSPINKREPGLTKYRQKRARLRQAGVHLLEIDLLRRGVRPLNHPKLPQAAYLITLSRAFAGRIEVWPVQLADSLPLVPVPLRDSDPDLPLALAAALTAVYDEAAYDLSLDYNQPPPPPPFSTEEANWLETILSKTASQG